MPGARGSSSNFPCSLKACTTRPARKAICGEVLDCIPCGLVSLMILLLTAVLSFSLPPLDTLQLCRLNVSKKRWLYSMLTKVCNGRSDSLLQATAPAW